jgi:S1-C subfamily serine protease
MHPTDIEDLQLKRKLTRELGRLVDSGEASPPQELLTHAPRTWPGVDLAAAPPHAIAPEEIYRSACRGVVAVGKLYLCAKCGKRHANIASGFVVARPGLIVTNFHVVDDADKLGLGIMTLGGSVYPVQSVVCANRDTDLAVLQVPAGDDLVPLPIGDEPPVGAPVYVVSHPAGRLFTFTSGSVSRYFVRGRGKDEVEQTGSTDAPVESRSRLMAITADFGRGSSGAPVLDARGGVVGVARQTESVYHHPEDDTPRRLQMVLKHCVPSRALRDLGVRTAIG